MSKLTQEKIDVLDKLYNIKGEKSVVTTAIQAKIEKKEADIDTTTTEKNHIIEQQVELEKELQQFIEQTDKFLATFSAFDNTSFSSFQSIGIDLALGDALATLRQKAPGHEDNLEDRIKSLKEQVEELSEKIASIEEKKNEFMETLNTAEEAKEKLNDLIEDILRNNNDSYPRKYVKDVLESLCFFTPDEISMLEFLILFKEEGLMEYDEGYEVRGNKYEEGLNPQEEVMLTGDIFAEEEVEEVAPVVEEEVTTKAPEINLAPSSGVLTPVADMSARVASVEETREPVIQVEETHGGIFAEETPVEMPTEETPVENVAAVAEPASNVEDLPVYDIPGVETQVMPEIDITEEDLAPHIDPESGAEEEEETATDEVSPRQPLGDTESEIKEEINPELQKKIEAAGLDINSMNPEDKERILELLETTNENTLNMNNELLRSIGVSQDSLYKVYNEE